MVDRPLVPEFAELQDGLVGDADERVPLLLAPPREGGSHHVEVHEAQTAEGRVLWSLGPEQSTTRVGSEPILNFLDSPKILALEDQEQEARNLNNFWEPTDSEDSDQQDGGRGQPLPLPAVPHGTHDFEC